MLYTLTQSDVDALSQMALVSDPVPVDSIIAILRHHLLTIVPDAIDKEFRKAFGAGFYINSLEMGITNLKLWYILDGYKRGSNRIAAPDDEDTMFEPLGSISIRIALVLKPKHLFVGGRRVNVPEEHYQIYVRDRDENWSLGDQREMSGSVHEVRNIAVPVTIQAQDINALTRQDIRQAAVSKALQLIT